MRRRREQRLSLPRRRNRQAEAIENRRRDVHLRGERQVRIGSCRAARRRKQRDPDVLVVEMPAVRPVALAQSFAVIARDHHNRIVQVVFRAKRGEELTDDAVSLPHLVVVAIRFVQLLENLVRLETRADLIVWPREDVRLGELHAEIVRSTSGARRRTPAAPDAAGGTRSSPSSTSRSSSIV